MLKSLHEGHGSFSKKVPFRAPCVHTTFIFPKKHLNTWPIAYLPRKKSLKGTLELPNFLFTRPSLVKILSLKRTNPNDAEKGRK